MTSRCDFRDEGVVGAEATADYCYEHQAFCDRAQPDTPRTADADDLANAAHDVRAYRNRSGCLGLAARLEAAAHLRPLEAAVLDAALAWGTHPGSGEHDALMAAVRALKDAKGG